MPFAAAAGVFVGLAGQLEMIILIQKQASMVEFM
jgi:hypothetical protein